MDKKQKKSKKKIINENQVDVSNGECSLDLTEEKEGISYEIIGLPEKN